MANTSIEIPRRKRCPMSAEQRAKLSLAQRAYVAHDPRWPEHRRKLAAAQEARRMMLFDNEVTAIVALRRKGRTFSYIAEEIEVCREVIGRELRDSHRPYQSRSPGPPGPGFLAVLRLTTSPARRPDDLAGRQCGPLSYHSCTSSSVSDSPFTSHASRPPRYQ
jgi:hypothetical protein